MFLLFKKYNSKFIFLDLEMTGLNEEKCEILELGLIITDNDFNQIANLDIVLWQSNAILDTMSPFVRNIHLKNGLIEKVKNSLISIKEAEESVMFLITKHISYKEGILVGNSIYIDRIFLRKYMKNFESYLNYRQIDITSIKILCKNWYSNKILFPKKKSNHTSINDIKNSISELKFYKDFCFKK